MSISSPCPNDAGTVQFDELLRVAVRIMKKKHVGIIIIARFEDCNDNQ